MGEPPAARDGVDDAVVVAWLRCAAAAVNERREWLTDLDAAIGDGDHGINLDRGFQAVLADLDAVDPGLGAAARLSGAGRRLLGLVGGASGALYGRGLMVAGDRLGSVPDGARGRERVAAALAGMIAGVTSLGRALPGDKTMLDALVPALDALRAAPPSQPIETALDTAAAAAEAGALATVTLVARKGRASYLGARSAGHQDPGAASSALLVRCLADAVAGRSGAGTTPQAPTRTRHAAGGASRAPAPRPGRGWPQSTAAWRSGGATMTDDTTRRHDWDRNEWVGEGQEPEGRKGPDVDPTTGNRWTKTQWVGEGQGEGPHERQDPDTMPEGENPLTGGRHSAGEQHWAEGQSRDANRR